MGSLRNSGFRGRRTGLRLLCRTVLPITLLASLLSASPVSADETPPAPPTPQLTDRGRVLQAWKDGGASVKAAAEIALTGTGDQVRLFLGTPQNPQDGELAKAEAKDNRAAALQMVTVGGPRLRAAAEAALAGTDQQVAAFVTTGWKTPLEQDQRVMVSQIAESGGPHTRAEALAVLDKPIADVQTFLDQTRYSLGDSDDRIKVSQLAESGGDATKQAARIALEGSAEEIRAFLETGQNIAAARDQEHASIDQLVQQAQTAGDEAARRKDAAKEASDRAVEAARLARQATADATAETLAAKNDAQRATAAANRAAEATLRASDAARASIAAAQAAVRAAAVASTAAARAAAAAAGAAQATTRALAAAAQGKVDEDAAASAAQAAVLTGYMVKAADKASSAAFDTAIAVDRANAATLDVDATADNADLAGGYADQAGASSAKARQAAAQARRNSGEASRSARAAAALARAAGQYAAEARDAAASAADRATKAAASARNASANAGNATNAAQQSAAHAESARQAAADAGAAVDKARQVHQQAQAAEAEERNSRKANGIVQAQNMKAAYDASQREADDAKTQALRLDQESVQLAAQAAQPGTDPATLAAAGRKMALTALKVRGPWAKAAAEYALTGSDEAVGDYVRTGWNASSEQDERATVLSVANSSQYDAVRTAATAALAGDGTQIHAFLQTGRYTAALSDYRIKVSQLIETGSPRVQAAAKTALETNTPDSLLTFLNRDQYTTKASDDRVTASQLIETGGDEVKIGAQVALEGPYPVLADFLTTGQYQAQQQDQLTAAHTASIDNAINGAQQVASLAQQNAAQAAQAAAIAAGAANDANNAAAQANAAASQAAGYAQQGKAAADRANGFAGKAAEYASTARAAQARAGQAAASAQSSAAYAQGSAAAARASADTAYAAVTAARQSAENAGWSADKSRVIAGRAQDEAIAQQLTQQAIDLILAQAEEEWLKSTIRAATKPSESSWYDTFSSIGHGVLDLASFFPVVGSPAAAINCAWYGGEYFADYASGEDVGLSCLSIIPFARLFRAGAKYVRGGDDLIKWGTKLQESSGAISKWVSNQVDKLPAVRRLLDDAPSCPTRPTGLPNSFPAGTRVLMGDKTTQPIEQIHSGDTVTATDPVTGTTGPRTVDDTIYTPDDTNFTELTVATTDGTKSTVTSTDHHPYWVQNTGQWTDAAEVRSGDTLRTDTGATAQVASTRHWTGLEPAYNLTVHDLHTYYVLAGDTPLLVHNWTPCFTPQDIFDRLPTWVKDAKIDQKTWGQAFRMGGDGIFIRELFGPKMVSGNLPEMTKEIEKFLLGKFGIPSMVHTHVETILAWMIRKSIQETGGNPGNLGIHVVINNLKGMCGNGAPAWTVNCFRAVQEILPVGQTLTVWVNEGGKMLGIPIEGLAIL
ncbi:polymorphic toxin-type HINT domain-containing protein [Kitasatospora sp. NPDC057904]|uniref:polymorphic toxin-type HINT domain-containing protein n=1 Tax=Kitasatospora sp. NPDC057904 TaxID=3346275 RepID=UPI0036DE8100